MDTNDDKIFVMKHVKKINHPKDITNNHHQNRSIYLHQNETKGRIQTLTI